MQWQCECACECVCVMWNRRCSFFAVKSLMWTQSFLRTICWCRNDYNKRLPNMIHRNPQKYSYIRTHTLQIVICSIIQRKPKNLNSYLSFYLLVKNDYVVLFILGLFHVYAHNQNYQLKMKVLVIEEWLFAYSTYSVGVWCLVLCIWVKNKIHSRSRSF